MHTCCSVAVLDLNDVIMHAKSISSPGSLSLVLVSPSYLIFFKSIRTSLYMNMTFNMTYMIFTAQPEGLICTLFYFLLMKYIPRHEREKKRYFNY